PAPDTQPAAQTQTAPQAPKVDEAQIILLPPALRDRGRQVLAEPDEVKRARLARDLARETGLESLVFRLSILATDPSSRVRMEILDRAARVMDPRVLAVLQQTVATDADTQLVLLALELLRVHHTRELSLLLTRRLEKARTSGVESDFRRLAFEQERWISLVRGTMLPGFMRVPPPIFSVKAPSQAVRVLAFGDFGNGSPEQKQIAAAMQTYHRQSAFDFGITLGDNFYSGGIKSLTDPRWKTQWGELYDPLGIKIFATYGNHDWGNTDSPVSELLYSDQSASWRMPAPYYTFTAGSVQFFALDTNEVSEAQLIWLKDELTKSNATWKLVYGHHPIYSAEGNDNVGLVQRLLPVLKGRADVYLTGHEHEQRHLKAEDGVHFFISGGGGAELNEPKPGPRSVFARATHGFIVVEADGRQLKVRFIDPTGKELHQATLSKSGAVAILVP
ncbi:MAG: metallophosphoesterase, partial [Acidobacteriota bacterium]